MFKRTRNIVWINLTEQGIFLLLKGTLTKKFREQWNLLIRNKGENVKFSREHTTPWEALNSGDVF